MTMMTRRQTRYFLARLVLFYNSAELCRKLSCSRPTLERWLKDETKPALKMLPVFRSAIEGLIVKLDQHDHDWGFGEEVADILRESKEPKHERQAAPPVNEAAAVRRWLHGRLERPMKTTKLYAMADEVGFSRTRLIYAAKALGVIKTHHGAGRGSFSVWRLP